VTPTTLLLRQVHPSFVQAGRVTSQAFRPTPKDQGHLSVDNGDLVQAQASWQRHTASAGPSAGVLAVAWAECDQLGLPVFEDGHPYPEHCSIDFSAHNNTAREQKAKLLRNKAQARGWQWQSQQ
jgi:hypothetical protein